MIPDELRRMLRGPFDDERVWMCDFPEATDGEIDHTEKVVEDYASDISATFDCLCFVETVGPESRPATKPEVVLICVLSRSADKEIFDTAMQSVTHEILTEVCR